MDHKKPKKTLRDQTAQSLLKSARIDGGRLLVKDRWGTPYVAQRSPSGGAITLTDAASGWTGALVMDAWCAAELAWWEAQLDALTPGREIWLLLDPEWVVVGHLAHRHLALNPSAARPWRIDNAARRPLPALGERYAPQLLLRPRRTRGPSAAR